MICTSTLSFASILNTYWTNGRFEADWKIQAAFEELFDLITEPEPTIVCSEIILAHSTQPNFEKRFNLVGIMVIHKLSDKGEIYAVPFFRYCTFDMGFLPLLAKYCDFVKSYTFEQMVSTLIFRYFDAKSLQVNVQLIDLCKKAESMQVDSVQAGIGMIAIVRSVGFDSIAQTLSKIDANLCKFFQMLFADSVGKFEGEMKITFDSFWSEVFFVFLKKFLHDQVFDEDENYLFEGFWNAIDTDTLNVKLPPQEAKKYAPRYEDAVAEYKELSLKFSKSLQRLPQLRQNGKDIYAMEEFDCSICLEPVFKKILVFKGNRDANSNPRKSHSSSDFCDWCSFSKMHCFHHSCISQWICSSSEKTCPVCRGGLKMI